MSASASETPGRSLPGGRIWILACGLLLVLNFLGSAGIEEIDHDEATFILVAQSLLDGSLPYTELFDNKPPGIFFLIAGAMKVFGPSIWAVRTVAWLSVLASVLLVHAVAKRLAGGPAAAAAAFAFAAFSAVPVMRYTSTELPASAMLAGALWLLVCRRQRLWALVLAGALISMATLTRTNLGFVAVAMGVAIACLEVFRGRAEVPRWATLGYVAGGLVPLGGLLALYARDGSLHLLWLAVVEVGLSYAGAADVWASARMQILIQVWTIRSMPLVYGGFALTAVAGALVSLARLRSAGRLNLLLLWIMVLAIFASMASTGAAFLHYWIQLYVFGAIFSALAYQWLLAGGWRRILAAGLVAAISVGALRQIGGAPVTMLLRPDARFEQHHIREAGARIAGARAPGDRVWAMRRHLVHWYLGEGPISPLATHPTNFVREWFVRPLEEAGFVAPGEFARVLSSRPAFLVMEPSGLPPELQEIEGLADWVDAHYAPFHENPQVRILRRAD